MQRILCTLAFLAATAFAQSANAQQAVGGYRPSRPTLSPYLYLTRPNFGPFPNYYTFVQPLKSQQLTNQESQYQVNQLQVGQVQLQQQQQQMNQINTIQVSPTGVGSTFNSLSHYYPSAGAPGGRSNGPRGKAPPRR